jgi:hypothetical protein
MSADVETGDLGRIGERRWQVGVVAGCTPLPGGSVGVAEPLVLMKCMGQVSLVPDEGEVEQFVAAGLYPPLHERVHPRHPGAAEPIRLRDVACLETLCGK